MHRRRRPHSISAPTPPSQSALIAASTVYHPSLAAAAAGAALRHATTSPTPIGTIPTKRMLKRRDSYSTPSDSDTPHIQRRLSSTSLTERRFRKRSPARRASVDERSRPPPRTWSDTENDGDDDSIISTRSFPTTLRSKPKPKAHKKPQKPTSAFSRGSLRDAPPSRRSIDSRATSSVHSLESIIEDQPLHNPPLPSNPQSLPPPNPTPNPPSPSRTTFSLSPSPTPPKHTPPPRSVSPAKSALKHTDRKTRVSFSDEDSGSSSVYTRPAALLFPDATTSRVLAPSPPPSDGEEKGLDEVLRYPRGMPPLGAAGAVKRLVESVGELPAPLNGEVPEVKVTVPTPVEERDGLDLVVPGGFPVGGEEGGREEEEEGGREEEERGGEEEEEAGDSGDSIYSDAYEEPPETTLPNILDIVPLSAVRERNPHPLPAATTPVLQPDFRRHSAPVPVSVSVSVVPDHSPDSSVSDLSESSFVRAPRERQGMMRSMRSAPTRVSKSRFSEDSEEDSEVEVGMGEFRSRFAGDSDEEGAVGKLRRRVTDGGVGRRGGKKGGFWKGVFKGGERKVIVKKVKVVKEEGGRKKRFKGLRKLFGMGH